MNADHDCHLSVLQFSRNAVKNILMAEIVQVISFHYPICHRVTVMHNGLLQVITTFNTLVNVPLESVVT